MEPIRLELLEDRIVPAHVDLPLSVAHAAAALAAPEQSPHEFLPAHAFGQSAAAEHNPHFSGTFRTLPWGNPDVP